MGGPPWDRGSREGYPALRQRVTWLARAVNPPLGGDRNESPLSPEKGQSLGLMSRAPNPYDAAKSHALQPCAPRGAVSLTQRTEDIMGRRTILLIAALVVAALGTALVFMYANRADERAQAGAEQVQVLVATAGIAAGTTGAAVAESGTVELRTLPAASVPPGALSDLTPVTDLITISSIFTGQVLIQPMFGTQQADLRRPDPARGQGRRGDLARRPAARGRLRQPRFGGRHLPHRYPAGAGRQPTRSATRRPASCSTVSRSSPSARPRSAPPPRLRARPPTPRRSRPRS